MTHPVPILLIHGFNGDPGDWTDGGFLRYLLERGDLDPDLIRLFRYGVAADGTYSNRADLRQISSRLADAGLSGRERSACSVDLLSANSVAKGGPARVTLIAHSLGGIISRYYLSRNEPDEFGTVYNGNVGRLITIGSPHRGVDLLWLAKLAPRDSLPWRFIRALEKLGLAPALPAEAIEDAEAALNARQQEERARIVPELSPGARVLLTDTLIYQQLAPDSTLLADLNRPGTMPAHVRCHAFYGDIRLRLRVGIGGLSLLDRVTSFGDLAVPAHSAREIPGTRASEHPFVTEQVMQLDLRRRAQEPGTRGLAESLPYTAHGKLLSNPAVHEGALSLLREQRRD